jgi:hypothetical protein
MVWGISKCEGKHANSIAYARDFARALHLLLVLRRAIRSRSLVYARASTKEKIAVIIVAMMISVTMPSGGFLGSCVNTNFATENLVLAKKSVISMVAFAASVEVLSSDERSP